MIIYLSDMIIVLIKKKISGQHVRCFQWE